MSVIKCDTCGKVFYRKPSHIKNHNFCSKECYRQWLSLNPPSQLIPYKKGNIPHNKDKTKESYPILKSMGFQKNHKAYEGTEETRFKKNDPQLLGKNNPNWRGGYNDYYGSNWRSQRRKVRKRDNYICQLCGEKQRGRALDVHHIKPFNEFHDYREANKHENLISLCLPCHRLINWHPELVEGLNNGNKL